MSGVGDGLTAANANWNFKGDVAKNFDEHVSRSVPFYNEGHELICNLSDFFVGKNSLCYELGTSTGELTLKLARHNSTKPEARFVGIDIEPDMIKMALEKKKQSSAVNVEFEAADIFQYNYEKADVFTAYYTLQFVKPRVRQDIFNRIYENLNWGGAFILFEKVRANDARFQDIMTGLYNEYKLRQGYTAEEIVSKARSLKGVLEPFSSQGNADLLKRAGFVDVITVFKYVCFEGFLAIK
ncbi:MAG: methyltransferase domain-containing protein [Deltaproteobacteria bacterium]|nr:methyltransferase domain-containing protein [Deltaproteobacteria bacterium]